MKLRQFGALKVQHGILKNVKPMLVRLLQNSDTITRIIPGEINRVKGVGDGHEVYSRVTVPLAQRDRHQTGWKAIVYASGCTQELFVSTVLPKDLLERELTLAGAKVRSSKELTIPTQKQAQQAQQSQEALYENRNFPVIWTMEGEDDSNRRSVV